MTLTTQELWETYSQELRRYIAARITWPVVDDILQQVFLKTHEKITTIKNKWAVKSWLYRTTQHAIIDRYRSEYWWKSWEMSDSFWDLLEDDTNSQNEMTITKNISSCLLPMIEDLDEQSRKVMERFLLPWVTQKIIAEELWLSVSNVKVIIHRAKKKLQSMYAQCCYQYKDEHWNIIDTRCSKNCWCTNTPIA